MSDEAEVQAMALLLERGFGFDQHCMVLAYETDSWNYYYPDGTYAGSKCEGAEHRGFLVHYDIDHEDESKFKEKAFKTAKEAAEFYIAYKNEHEL